MGTTKRIFESHIGPLGGGRVSRASKNEKPG